MCLPSKVLWCFVLLFVASFSESQENYANGDKQSDSSMMRYDRFASSIKYRNDEIKSIRCISRESSLKNDDEYDSYINSTKNETKNDNSKRYESRGRIIKECEESNQISMESAANSTEINDSMIQEIKNFSRIERESNSTTDEHGNSNKNSKKPVFIDIVPYEMCHNITCVQLCCPFRNFISIKGKCVANESASYYLPKRNSVKNDSDYPDFSLTVHDPCRSKGYGRSLLPYYEYLFLNNGSLYQGPGKFILPASYCLATFNQEIYSVLVCNNEEDYPMYASACFLVSLPFIVYSILPELQNMHGYTLRAHIVSLFISYLIMYCVPQIPALQQVDDEIGCTTLAYIYNFFLLSTFFWLNVTCFDIWWTFRKLRSNRTNIKQGKKKFVMYSIYAWGIPLILNVICAIVDNVDGIPNNWKPQLCTKNFWFGGNLPIMIYFFIPMSVTIISNICFFIATTVTIMCQNKRTAQQLSHSESKCHNENKQRFKMYLKLFIVMGITWIMEIMAWFVAWFTNFSLPPYIWYPTNMLNSLQGLIIFIIFVCKKKTKQQLLKRFGGQNCAPFCKILMYITRKSSSINTTSTLGTVPMQEIDSSNPQPVSQRLNLTRSIET